ncbi:ABC transporter permease [Caballeronia sp. RCC_10]|uniref:ABC transporter permease n=1 Tax=Caballeronia sp. RCC_10 TaxID=3239227 RepID=UPI0035259C87
MRNLDRNLGAALSGNAYPGGSDDRKSLLRLFDDSSRIWVGLATLFAASAVIAPGTVSKSSLLAMLPFAAILAIVATGQTLVIQQRGIDMSATGMMALGGVLMAKLGGESGLVFSAAFVAIFCSGVIGALNGFLVSRIAITPLVATLAVNALITGAVRAFSGNVPISVSPSMQFIAHANLFGIPACAVFAGSVTALGWTVTRKTTIGRRFVAAGVNAGAAEAAGVRVIRVQIAAYCASATYFSVAGMLLAGYVGSASQALGNGYLLPAIAAVVLGGTPFTGGRGSVMASAAAALFMAQLGQLALALGAGPAVQLLVQATAILVATAVRALPAMVRTIRLRAD